MVDAKNDTTSESFLTKAKNALNNLVEVKVVTLVGNLPVTIASKSGATETTLAAKDITDNAIITIVKLLDGDVTTVIAEDLLANTELRDLHTAQVAASLDVLPRNLKALVDIAKSLVNE